MDIEVAHPELAEHWLAHLPSTNFNIGHDSIPYHAIDRLRSSIKDINQLLVSKFGIKIFDYGEVKLDQHFLNQVHRDWALVQEKNSNISRVIKMLDSGLLEKFYDINDAFHEIEDCSEVQYVEESSETQFKFQMPGIANPERFLVHGRSQIELQYWSIGRSDYDAWGQGDKIALIDNFTLLPFTFDVFLIKPFSRLPPPQYVEWMQERGKKPVGSHMPLGNFKHYLDSVGDLYEIFVRNNKVDQKVRLSL